MEGITEQGNKKQRTQEIIGYENTKTLGRWNKGKERKKLMTNTQKMKRMDPRKEGRGVGYR